MMNFFLQAATAGLALVVAILCFDHVRRTHPSTDSVFHWLVALVLCLGSTWAGYEALQRDATVVQFGGVVCALIWLLVTWKERHASQTEFLPTMRELRTMEFPFVHGGKQ